MPVLTAARTSDHLKPRPVAELLSEANPDRVLLGLPEDADRLYVETGKTRDGTFFGASARTSPFLDYSRGRLLDTHRLSQSNLAGYWSWIDPATKQTLDKSDEFVRWARSVMQWVRRSTPEWHLYKNYRITQKVAEAVREGLQIVN